MSIPDCNNTLYIMFLSVEIHIVKMYFDAKVWCWIQTKYIMKIGSGKSISIEFINLGSCNTFIEDQ